MQIKKIHTFVAAPVLVVALGLPVSFACAEVGDFDPSFVDHGRQVAIPGATGTARSVDLPDTGGIFAGGGRIALRRFADECIATATSFATRLCEDGAADPAFDPAGITVIEGMDVARQADGRIVGVGHTAFGDYRGGRCNSVSGDKLAAFRLMPDGSPDFSFGALACEHDANQADDRHQERAGNGKAQPAPVADLRAEQHRE